MREYLKGIAALGVLASAVAAGYSLARSEHRVQSLPEPTTSVPERTIKAVSERLREIESRLKALESNRGALPADQARDDALDVVRTKVNRLSLSQQLLAGTVDAVLRAQEGFAPVAASSEDAPAGRSDTSAALYDSASVYSPLSSPNPGETMAATFWDQAHDPSWTQVTEMGIRQNWDSSGLANSRFVGVECHTSVCRLEVGHDDEMARELFLMDFGRLLPFDAEAAANPNGEGGAAMTVLYLSRSS